jgi:hypothetical protein
MIVEPRTEFPAPTGPIEPLVAIHRGSQRSLRAARSGPSRKSSSDTKTHASPAWGRHSIDATAKVRTCAQRSPRSRTSIAPRMTNSTSCGRFLAPRAVTVESLKRLPRNARCYGDDYSCAVLARRNIARRGDGYQPSTIKSVAGGQKEQRLAREDRYGRCSRCDEAEGLVQRDQGGDSSRARRSFELARGGPWNERR